MIYILGICSVGTLKSKISFPVYHTTRGNRLHWFRQCLDELATVNIKSVVISHNIGCRLGGGDWADYFNIISDFALRTNIEIVISIPRFAK